MIDFLLNVDDRLVAIADWAGPWAYVVLFAIIFAETGFVVTPFLPGDSLHFAAGALAATGLFDMLILVPTLIVAAIAGNTVNYSIGSRIAHRFLSTIDGPLGRFVKPKHVREAHEFFLRHGGKAVTLAQFVPIVRTFLPFVAGGAGMPYRSFLTFNASGAVAWVGICSGAGYLFGNIPVVKQNFELVVLGIVGVSVLPIVVEILKTRRRPAAS
jgi:membrane-associated protein